MSLIRQIFILTFILIVISSTLDASWLEYENLSLSSQGQGFPGPGFFKIPDTSFYIYGFKLGQTSYPSTLNDNMIVFDSDSMIFRDFHTGDISLLAPIIFFDKNYGWNIYYIFFNDVRDIKLGKLHMQEDGKFGNMTTFPYTLNGPWIASVYVVSKDEAWFATDKLYRLKKDSEEWTSFDFPEDWDNDFIRSNIILSEDQKTLSIYSVITSNSNTQLAFFDLDNDKFNTMIKLDIDRYIIDIQQWKGHDNQFLILTQNSLWTYDSTANKAELCIDGFFATGKIFQSETGQEIYIFSLSTSPYFSATDFYVMNPETKTIEKDVTPLESNWGFSAGNQNLPYFDIENNRIITLIDTVNGTVYHGKIKIGYIDLNDFSFHYFLDGAEFLNITRFCYDNEKNILLSGMSGTNYNLGSKIVKINLETGEKDSTINLSFRYDSWSTMKGSDSPTLIGNSRGWEFVNLLPNNRRQIVNTSSNVSSVSLYKDGLRALVSEEAGLFEYLLSDGSSENIQLPYIIKTFYTNPVSNDIIGIGNNIVSLIRPHGQARFWNCENGNADFKTHYFDPDNELVWMIFQDKNTNEWLFYKISSATGDELDFFSLPFNTFSMILNFMPDPLQKYLYFIDDNKNLKKRDLVIIDTINKAVAKRYTIQNNVAYNSNNTTVFPGIIPVTEKNRLFLWDHYGSWCFDYDNMNLIYGTLKSNPVASDLNSAPTINGYWDEKKEKVVIVDRSYSVANFTDRPLLAMIDIDTGIITADTTNIPNSSEVSAPFFPKDHDKIYFLNPSKSSVYTLYLDPAWDTPVQIKLSTNYIEFIEGDKAKFTINVKNPYDFEQKATAYIWLYAPDVDTPFFFDGSSLTTEAKGITLTLPANLDVTGDILSFTMPAGLPEGFYNFNAVFINEHGDRGPIGTWNFYVKD
jgi:hypothetical protein